MIVLAALIVLITGTDAAVARGTVVSGAPSVDYTIDLTTRVKTPLPSSIASAVVEPEFGAGRYAASPGGSRLAFVGRDRNGKPQIFVARIDGTGIRQLTNDPRAARSPAWSPDGRKIAFEGFGHARVRHLFVLEIATGRVKGLAASSRILPLQSQFTPDGSSLLFTGGSGSYPVLRTVSVAGGKSTLFIGPGEGVTDAGNGSISPDGKLVTFLGSGSSEGRHCGPCRLVARADGTERRIIPGWVSNPAGTWSPDGRRIVCADFPGTDVIVVDVTTRRSVRVAKGSSAIWLDRHTLLVQAVA